MNGVESRKFPEARPLSKLQGLLAIQESDCYDHNASESCDPTYAMESRKDNKRQHSSFVSHESMNLYRAENTESRFFQF